MVEKKTLLAAVLAVAVIFMLIGGGSSQSISGQSTLQTESGKQYILTNVIFDRNDGENLVLVNSGEKLGDQVAGNEIRMVYSGINTYYEMGFVKRETLQCYELTALGVSFGNPYDLKIDIYQPKESGKMLTKAALNLQKNGSITKSQQFTFDNLNKVIDLGGGAKFDVEGLAIRSYTSLPAKSDLYIVMDREANKAYVVDRIDLDAKLAKWRAPRMLSDGSMKCYGTGVLDVFSDMRASFKKDILDTAKAKSPGDYGAKTFGFDVNSLKGRWFYDISAVSLKGTVWIPSDMASLVLYSSPKAKPTLASFSLSNVGPQTGQKFSVKNNGDTGTVFFKLDGDGAVTVYPATFSAVIPAGETKTFDFQTYKTKGGDNVCVTVTVSADGGSDTKKSCAQTTADPAAVTGVGGDNPPDNPLDLFDYTPAAEEDSQPGAPLPNTEIPTYVTESFSEENPAACSAVTERACGEMDFYCKLKKDFDLKICEIEETLNVVIPTAVITILLAGAAYAGYWWFSKRDGK